MRILRRYAIVLALLSPLSGPGLAAAHGVAHHEHSEHDVSVPDASPAAFGALAQHAVLHSDICTVRLDHWGTGAALPESSPAALPVIPSEPAISLQPDCQVSAPPGSAGLARAPPAS